MPSQWYIFLCTLYRKEEYKKEKKNLTLNLKLKLINTFTVVFFQPSEEITNVHFDMLLRSYSRLFIN